VEARDAFRDLALVNGGLATGTAWREEQVLDVVGWVERARVLRQHWN
jgi:hypothetical protein